MSHTIGIGIDVVETQALSEALERTPALGQRLFLPSELARPIESMAGRFAAKEALAKALGGGDLPWTDVEVTPMESGAPSLRLSGAVAARASALGVTETHVSITHDGRYAAAVVVLEGQAASESAAKGPVEAADPTPTEASPFESDQSAKLEQWADHQ